MPLLTYKLEEPVYEALMAEKVIMDKHGIGCQTVIDGHRGFVFYNRFFEVHIPESINRQLARIIENYNLKEEIKAAKENREPIPLPQFTCHHLRHTFCTRLCEADVHIKVIQSIMGHKDIQTTLDIYSEVTEWKKKTSVEEAFKDANLF